MDHVHLFKPGVDWSTILPILEELDPIEDDIMQPQSSNRNRVQLNSGTMYSSNPAIFSINPQHDSINLYKCPVPKCGKIVKKQAFGWHMRQRHQNSLVDGHRLPAVVVHSAPVTPLSPSPLTGSSRDSFSSFSNESSLSSKRHSKESRSNSQLREVSPLVENGKSKKRSRRERNVEEKPAGAPRLVLKLRIKNYYQNSPEASMSPEPLGRPTSNASSTSTADNRGTLVSNEECKKAQTTVQTDTMKCSEEVSKNCEMRRTDLPSTELECECDVAGGNEKTDSSHSSTTFDRIHPVAGDHQQFPNGYLSESRTNIQPTTNNDSSTSELQVASHVANMPRTLASRKHYPSSVVKPRVLTQNPGNSIQQIPSALPTPPAVQVRPIQAHHPRVPPPHPTAEEMMFPDSQFLQEQRQELLRMQHLRELQMQRETQQHQLITGQEQLRLHQQQNLINLNLVNPQMQFVPPQLTMPQSMVPMVMQPLPMVMQPLPPFQQQFEILAQSVNTVGGPVPPPQGFRPALHGPGDPSTLFSHTNDPPDTRNATVASLLETTRNSMVVQDHVSSMIEEQLISLSEVSSERFRRLSGQLPVPNSGSDGQSVPHEKRQREEDEMTAYYVDERSITPFHQRDKDIDNLLLTSYPVSLPFSDSRMGSQMESATSVNFPKLQVDAITVPISPNKSSAKVEKLYSPGRNVPILPLPTAHNRSCNSSDVDFLVRPSISNESDIDVSRVLKMTNSTITPTTGDRIGICSNGDSESLSPIHFEITSVDAITPTLEEVGVDEECYTSQAHDNNITISKTREWESHRKPACISNHGFEDVIVVDFPDGTSIPEQFSEAPSEKKNSGISTESHFFVDSESLIGRVAMPENIQGLTTTQHRPKKHSARQRLVIEYMRLFKSFQLTSRTQQKIEKSVNMLLKMFGRKNAEIVADRRRRGSLREYMLKTASDCKKELKEEEAHGICLKKSQTDNRIVKDPCATLMVEKKRTRIEASRRLKQKITERLERFKYNYNYEEPEIIDHPCYGEDEMREVEKNQSKNASVIEIHSDLENVVMELIPSQTKRNRNTSKVYSSVDEDPLLNIVSSTFVQKPRNKLSADQSPFTVPIIQTGSTSCGFSLGAQASSYPSIYKDERMFGPRIPELSDEMKMIIQEKRFPDYIRTKCTNGFHGTSIDRNIQYELYNSMQNRESEDRQKHLLHSLYVEWQKTKGFAKLSQSIEKNRRRLENIGVQIDEEQFIAEICGRLALLTTSRDGIKMNKVYDSLPPAEILENSGSEKSSTILENGASLFERRQFMHAEAMRRKKLREDSENRRKKRENTVFLDMYIPGSVLPREKVESVFSKHNLSLTNDVANSQKGRIENVWMDGNELAKLFMNVLSFKSRDQNLLDPESLLPGKHTRLLCSNWSVLDVSFYKFGPMKMVVCRPPPINLPTVRTDRYGSMRVEKEIILDNPANACEALVAYLMSKVSMLRRTGLSLKGSPSLVSENVETSKVSISEAECISPTPTIESDITVLTPESLHLVEATCAVSFCCHERRNEQLEFTWVSPYQYDKTSSTVVELRKMKSRIRKKKKVAKENERDLVKFVQSLSVSAVTCSSKIPYSGTEVDLCESSRIERMMNAPILPIPIGDDEDDDDIQVIDVINRRAQSISNDSSRVRSRNSSRAIDNETVISKASDNRGSLSTKRSPSVATPSSLQNSRGNRSSSGKRVATPLSLLISSSCSSEVSSSTPSPTLSRIDRYTLPMLPGPKLPPRIPKKLPGPRPQMPSMPKFSIVPEFEVAQKLNENISHVDISKADKDSSDTPTTISPTFSTTTAAFNKNAVFGKPKNEIPSMGITRKMDFEEIDVMSSDSVPAVSTGTNKLNRPLPRPKICASLPRPKIAARSKESGDGHGRESETTSLLQMADASTVFPQVPECGNITSSASNSTITPVVRKRPVPIIGKSIPHKMGRMVDCGDKSSQTALHDCETANKVESPLSEPSSVDSPSMRSSVSPAKEDEAPCSRKAKMLQTKKSREEIKMF